MFVLHRCDNRRCCNPAHLFLGTHSDNMRDAASKGRLAGQARPECLARGASHPNAKLNDEAVQRIREMRNAGLGYAQIGQAFGVKKSAVWAIVNGRAWKHVAVREAVPGGAGAEGQDT